MSPAGAALFRAIRANPDNDAHRLVYADWLEEEFHNRHLPAAEGARAEFIRLQCRLAADATLTNAVRQTLWQRAHDLLRTHAHEWEQPLRQLGASIISYERGFPTAVGIGFREFLDNAGAILSAAPITCVRIFGLRNAQDVRELMKSRHLSGLSRLMLDIERDGDAAAQEIAGCKRLASLRDLAMQRCGLTASGAAALANSRRLTGLTELNLGGNQIGDAGLQSLARSPHLSGLKNLAVFDNGIGDAGANALAATKYLRRLTEINLTGNNLGPAGAHALATSPRLPGLARLDLQFNNLGPAVLSEIDRGLAARGNPGRSA